MEIEKKEIRGINFRQVVGYTLAITALAAGYFDIRNEIHTNREQTVITRDMIKEDRELRRLEIQALKQDLKLNADLQRESQVRLTLLEFQVKQITK